MLRVVAGGAVRERHPVPAPAGHQDESCLQVITMMLNIIIRMVMVQIMLVIAVIVIVIVIVIIVVIVLVWW